MSGDARCRRCRRPLPGDASFCPGCGAAQAGAGEVVIELGDDGPSGPASDVTFESTGNRGRWVGAGVAAVLVVAIGASVVTGGGSERAATTTTAPSTTVAATTTSTTTATPTTAPAPTTSTTLRVVGTGPGPLLGEPTGLTLLIATYQGVRRLDLDTGALVDVDDGPVSNTSAEDLQAVRGGYLKWVQGELYEVPVGGEGRRLERSANGQLLGTDVSGAAWMLLYPTGPEDPVPTLARLAAVGAEVERVAVPWMPDPWLNMRPDGVGGLLLNVVGGVFRWADLAGDPVAVAPGSLVDASGRFALTRTCYPAPTCELTVTDVIDGGVRTLPDPGPGASEGARVSPDGEWVLTDVAVQAYFGPAEPEARAFRAWSLSDGRMVELPLEIDAPVNLNGWSRSAVAFSPDGRWLVYAGSAGTLRVWQVGSSAPIDLEIPELQLNGALSFEVRETP